MPEFFLELFSEEIPARLQHSAREQLYSVVNSIAVELDAGDTPIPYCGPRRLAVSARVAGEKPGSVIEAKGPKENSSEPAVAGFLRKYGAKHEDLAVENGYFILRRSEKSVLARQHIENVLPDRLLSMIRWPKSMRWGQSGDFAWIRPLRRIVCLLDGEVVPIKFGPITASNVTEGHRMHALTSFTVSSINDWQQKLRDHNVIVDDQERRRIISEGLIREAASLKLSFVEDEVLLAEVIGLVEWPMPLIGRIDRQFMDLPPEVRELSMKLNQKYFALRDTDGKPAQYFGFVANLEAQDGGAAIIAGNERVLRARLADARHFWDLDLKTPLNELLPKLESITFHAKIGTQKKRAEEIASLSRELAQWLGADEYLTEQAQWAGLLCKADLVTGMVTEFPELQGVIGAYYAEKNPQGWDGQIVGQAIKTHYHPKGPSESVPTDIVAIAVALADKLYTLIEFFRIEEKPTGSSDPYALRRAALGVIRIILENNIEEIDLAGPLFKSADLLPFILDRLKVKLRAEGQRFDVLDAAFAVSADGNLTRLMKRIRALTEMLATDDGRNLQTAYKRAANILRIEDPKDALRTSIPIPQLLKEQAEITLAQAMNEARDDIINEAYFQNERYVEMMNRLAALRPAVDEFFKKVTVNDSEQDVRRNRLKLLAQFRDTVHLVADFSKLEG